MRGGQEYKVERGGEMVKNKPTANWHVEERCKEKGGRGACGCLS